MRKVMQGEVMAVRLAPDFTRTGRLGCSTLVLVATVAVLAGMVWAVLLKPGLWFFLVVLGIFSTGVFRFFHASVRYRHLADPIVEVDREPVPPGGRLRIYLRQPEPAGFDEYRVTVVCERERDQGKPYRRELLSLRDVRRQIVHRLELDLPKQSIGSRKALNDSVQWKIIVERRVGKLKLDVDYVFRVWRDTGMSVRLEEEA